MSLITPDFGLLFWMVLIFGILFFVLAKFGFPVITNMVEKRSEHIESSLRAAEQAQEKLEGIAQEKDRILEETRIEQGRIIKEAADTRDAIVAQARTKAAEEAAIMVEQARTKIAAERENALRDIRREVAVLGVEVAEELVRKELKDDEAQLALIDRLVSELPEKREKE